MKVRELEKEFEKRGVRYTQVVKNDVFVVYRCVSLDYEDTYFEVFRYRQGKPHPMDTGGWDMVELYPSDNAFGVWAWSCSNADSVNKVLKKHFDVDCVNLINDKCL